VGSGYLPPERLEIDLPRLRTCLAHSTASPLSLYSKLNLSNLDDKTKELLGCVGQSKQANLLFTYELDRRLRAAGSSVAAVACHPGVVHTDLFANSTRAEQFLLSPSMRIVNFWAVQSARMGALPALRAATDPSARGWRVLRPAPVRPAAPVLHRLPGGGGVERPLPRRGVRDFSMAEASRRLGVTAAAPYRHFADRDELLAAVAAARLGTSRRAARHRRPRGLRRRPGRG
jgi:hypothetical protein